MALKTSKTRLTRRQLEIELASVADVSRAANLAWFFKTGKGQYGEGDRFLGITVPVARKIALRYQSLPLADLARLLKSKYHEHRYVALEILVAQFESAEPGQQAIIFDFYLRNTAGINNWDLVDTSAREIVGGFLKSRPRDILDRLAESPNIWERRLAIVATHAFIRSGHLADTFRISEKLLPDKHDLIHKAVGWMLREAGKVSRADLTVFLETHYQQLPRTALRYAIEHFTAAERKRILSGVFR